MKFVLRYFGLCLLICVVLFSKANAINWEAAVSVALRSNESIQSAKRQLDSAQWSYYRSLTNFLPQISANAAYTGGIASDESATRLYATGLSATEYLFKGFQNYYGVVSASNNLDQSRATLNKTISDTLFSLRQAFIDLYISQQNVSLSAKILERLKQNTRLIKLQYDSGREDKGSYLATAAAQKGAEYNLSSAKRNLRLSRLNMSRMVGIDITSADADEIASIESISDFNGLLKKSPVYLIAYYQLKSADIAAQNTIGEFLPTISLSGNYANTGDQWPPDDLRRSWSLNISYNFFPGGSNITDSLINNFNLEKAKQDFQAASKSLLFSIEQSYENAKDAIEALDASTFSLDAATERARIADAKYLDGLIAYDEWSRIINDYISAQMNTLNKRRAALNAIAAWKNSYGGW